MIKIRSVQEYEINTTYPSADYWNWKDTAGNTSGVYSNLLDWVSGMDFTLEPLGKSQDGNYDLYGFGIGRSTNPTVLLTPNQHGWERGGSHYAPLFMKMLRDREYLLPEHDNILNHLSFYQVVSCNPYGYEHGTRRNGNGVDLNRNWVLNFETYGEGTEPFSEAETQIMRDLVIDKKPIAVVDIHQWGGSSKTGIGMGLNPKFALWSKDVVDSLNLNASGSYTLFGSGGLNGTLPSFDNWVMTQTSNYGSESIGILLEAANTVNNQAKAHQGINALLMLSLYLIEWVKSRKIICN